MIKWTTMTAQMASAPAIAAVVLAAGGSTRMGEPKQLLLLGEKPMVRRTTEAVCAAGLDQVVVVIGAQANAVQQALAGLPVEFAVNQDWAKGMSTSLRAGLCMLRPAIQAVLVVLADQPEVSPGLLRTLVERYEATGAAIVVPFYQGQRGNPVLFDRSIFPELLAVQGDRGGRELLARHREKLERVDTDDAAVVLDVDTRQDYEQVRDMPHDNQSRP
jgi:molybdenum cofactor cytidylyltransferase